MNDLDLLTEGGFDQSSLPARGLDQSSSTPNPPNQAETVNFTDLANLPTTPKTPPTQDRSLLNIPQNPALAHQEKDEYLCTYSGSDMKVLLEVPGSGKNAKVLLELVTLSVSVHREKSPARALGYINPKGFARGRRTVGGTMILTQFNVDFLYRFLGMKLKDVSKDTMTAKMDQLPPFNLTLMFMDELGHSSCRHLLGCDIVTDGTVYSSNDMMSEQSISYIASDFTPLLPVGFTGEVDKSADPRTLGAEKTVKDAVEAKRSALKSTVSV
jgi:hypothetical protein